MSPDERRGAPVSAEARPPAAGPPFLAVCGSRKPAPGISRPSAARELLRAVVQGMAEAGVGDLREVRSTAVLLASLKEFGRYVAGIGAVQAPIAAIRPAFAPVPGPSVGAGR